MPKNALVVAETKEIAEPKVTQKDLDDYLFGTGTKLTDQEKRLFFGIALTQNLNPLKREVYAIKYGDKMSLVTGYETYLRRAERTGLLDGWTAIVEEKKTTDHPKEWVATCTIYRKDRQHPVIVEAWFSEYNQGNTMWKTKPRTMIRKVAIAQAFRMAFPEDLGGIPYTPDEIAAGETQEAEFTPLDEQAIKVADEDLKARKDKAIKWLSDKGKAVFNCENHLKRSYGDWTEEDLNELKAWAKAGFPESEPEEIEEIPI